MKIAHVLVCHTVRPVKLFASIPPTPGDIWHVYLHSDDAGVEAIARSEMERRDSRNVFDYKMNRGLSVSWNDSIHLAMEADCDGVMLLNDDLFFYPEGYADFRNTITLMHLNKDLLMISVRGLEAGCSLHAGEVHTQSFACGFIPRAVIEKLGYFDENFKPAYFEDVDYHLRGTRAGLHIHADPRVLVEHERSSTIDQMTSAQRKTLDRDRTANAAYFHRKWGSFAHEGAFRTPFDQGGGLSIPFRDRHDPYPEQADCRVVRQAVARQA